MEKKIEMEKRNKDNKQRESLNVAKFVAKFD